MVASEVGAVDIEAKQLEPFRIAGETKIVPNDLDRVHLPLGAQAVGQFQICLDATGKPLTVAVVNTSGIANYDTKIVGRMRAWSFKPILVEGQPVKVCSVITVVFRQDKLIRVEQH